MATLGVGVRVFIGYCDPRRVLTARVGAARGRTGTIAAGPFPPNVYVDSETGRLVRLRETGWQVTVDDGGEIVAVESMLFPFDDDGLDELEALLESERPEPAVAEHGPDPDVDESVYRARPGFSPRGSRLPAANTLRGAGRVRLIGQPKNSLPTPFRHRRHNSAE